MDTRRHDPDSRPAPRAAANERLKGRWNGWLGLSMVAAVAVHAAAFALWPEARVEGWARQGAAPSRMIAVGAAPTVRVPEPPAPLPRVAAPELPTLAELAEEVVAVPQVSLPVIKDAALEELAALIPHNAALDDQWLNYEHFAPFIVYPRVRNEREVKRFLERHYGPIMQMSGATGVVQMLFWIDEGGEVWKAELAQSSGHRSLDRLAQRMSRILRFSPALRLGRPVKVQVLLPISFRQAT